MCSRTILALALAASASAHMVMLFPKPFANSTLNNSPLATAAEFPCKQRPGMYNIDLEMNQWNAGQTQVVSFMGSAVHGGGSCQFSITTDPEPTKDSQWKVIQSVEGNCPSDADGNIGDSSTALVAGTFPVTMPSDIPDGRYTFAWSWINKVGNREFYMNCAPIQVGSGSDTASAANAAEALSALPDMFVTNIPGDKDLYPNTYCATTHGTDFVYPNPGQTVVKGTKVKFDKTYDGPGCVAQEKLGTGAGKIGSPSAGTPSTPSQGTAPAIPSKSAAPSTPSQGTTPSKPSSAPSPPQVSQKPVASPDSGYGAPQQSKIPSNPGGGQFAPVASSAPAAVPTPQPSPPAAAQPVPSTAPQTPSDNNNTTPTNSECTPCTNDGAVVCIGSKQFGLCNRGCVVAQDLAAGMACTDGVVVAATKRHVHFPRAHLHRRFTAARLL